MTDYADLIARLEESASGKRHYHADDLREAAAALTALVKERDELFQRLVDQTEWTLEAIEPFADCAIELEGSEDVPRAPDGEWAKFRLLTDDYRRAAALRERILSRTASDVEDAR